MSYSHDLLTGHVFWTHGSCVQGDSSKRHQQTGEETLHSATIKDPQNNTKSQKIIKIKQATVSKLFNEYI